MTRASLREYAAIQRERYYRATRAEKHRLLDEVVTVTGMHRKAVIRLLRRPPARLLKAFRACRNGVLFGATTYWQGVDVAGEALRCVILTRLPFQVPDHPLAEARHEAILAKGGDPFVEDTLPDAILTFRQGFGRLIRTRRDRGVVAILDPRLRTKSYGALFLSSLPRCRIVHSLEAVRAMFSRERVPS